MSGEGIAAIIGASGGAVSGIFGFWLTNRLRSKKLNANLMQNNYQTLYLEMRKEIARIQTEQSDERKQWAEERLQFNKKIESLQDEIRQQDSTLHKKDIKVVELNGKIEILTVQLEIYKNESRNPSPIKKVSVET